MRYFTEKKMKHTESQKQEIVNRNSYKQDRYRYTEVAIRCSIYIKHIDEVMA